MPGGAACLPPRAVALAADLRVCHRLLLQPQDRAGDLRLLIAIKRDEHHPHWSERFENPPAPPAAATPVERMAHRLKTPTGRATYALRKQTVEPVFGIIKSVMGFRQFLTRGLDNVQNEWTLVCLAWNLKRMAALRLQ